MFPQLSVNLPPIIRFDGFVLLTDVLAFFSLCTIVVGARIAANTARIYGEPGPDVYNVNFFAVSAATVWSICLLANVGHPDLFGKALTNLARTQPNLYLALLVPIFLIGIGILSVFEWMVRTLARSEYSQIRFRTFLWVT